MPVPEIPHHPLVTSLVSDTSLASPLPASAVKFSGYVGPASQDGLVRLYVTLSNLSDYIEFDKNAVVQTADAPETVLPDKATTVWVKANTRVRTVREYANASDLDALIASGRLGR